MNQRNDILSIPVVGNVTRILQPSFFEVLEENIFTIPVLDPWA